MFSWFWRRFREPRLEGSPAFRRSVVGGMRLLDEITLGDVVRYAVRRVRQVDRIDGAYAAAWPVEEGVVSVRVFGDPEYMAWVLLHEAGHILSYREGLKYYGRLGETRADALTLALLADGRTRGRVREVLRKWPDIPETGPLPGNPLVEDG